MCVGGGGGGGGGERETQTELQSCHFQPCKHNLYSIVVFVFSHCFLLLQGTESCRRKSYSAWMRSNSDG